mgnify:CR=1 FL=1
MRILPAIETNVITIEKNIPIPSIVYPGRRSHGKYSFVYKMEVGDSFKINGNTPNFKPKKVRQFMYTLNCKKSLDMRFAVHTLAGHSKDPEAIRVWRIK